MAPIKALSYLGTVYYAYRLVGLVVKASATRVEDPGFDSRLRCRDFSGSSHTSDLYIGTPVATRYRLSAGSSWLVTVYCDLVGKFDLQLLSQCGIHKRVWVDPSLRYTIACYWDVMQASNQAIKQASNQQIYTPLLPLSISHLLLSQGVMRCNMYIC